MGEGETLGSIEVREKVPLSFSKHAKRKEKTYLLFGRVRRLWAIFGSFAGLLLSFVFVTPESDCLQEEEKYQRRISRLTGGDHFVHVGNLARAEEPYEGLLRESRADLFGALLFFYLRSGLNCARFRARKDGIDSNDGIGLSIRISLELGKWISRHLEHLTSFDEIELLYDYGQPNLVRFQRFLLLFQCDVR